MNLIEMQDQVSMERIQRRVLHMFAQSAEVHLAEKLEESLPTPERNDSFHPAQKQLV